MPSWPSELLARLGPGAAVACNLRCPNFICQGAAVIPGSGEVVNEYGVKDLMPSRCPTCGVLLRVDEFIDLEST